jgi:hypothetical protein
MSLPADLCLTEMVLAREFALPLLPVHPTGERHENEPRVGQRWSKRAFAGPVMGAHVHAATVTRHIEVRAWEHGSGPR